MVWVLSCSILLGGLVFYMFHPSRWLREPSEGRELLVLKSVSPLPSSCFSEDWSFEGCLWILSRAAPHFLCKLSPESGFYFLFEAWSLEEGCNVVRKRPPLPCSLALKTFVMYTFLVCDIHFGLSRRFLGFDSFWVVDPLVFFCIVYNFDFSRRFLGLDSCFESSAPWLS